jgi:hypothetical protein
MLPRDYSGCGRLLNSVSLPRWVLSMRILTFTFSYKTLTVGGLRYANEHFKADIEAGKLE